MRHSHSHLVREGVSVKGKPQLNDEECSTDVSTSLVWIELHTILAKLHFSYDLEFLNTDMDWHRDSRMQTLWKKPELKVRVHPRV